MDTRAHVRRIGLYLWREWIRPLALPCLLITAAKSAIADINIVPSGSMKPSILEGDVVFINKLAYDFRVPFTYARLARWAEPSRGDVVVCFAPDDGMRLVKRIVGVPGDTIALRGDVLFVNGVRQAYAPLPADAAGVRDLAPAEQHSAVFAREQLSPTPGSAARTHAVMALPGMPARRDFGPLKLAAGTYFMMGDNRDKSRDSRYFGPMPRERIIGEVKAVVLSADPAHWLRPRFDRFGTALE